MGNIKQRELTARQPYWLEHLRACEVSGQKMGAYATGPGAGVVCVIYCQEAAGETGRDGILEAWSAWFSACAGCRHAGIAVWTVSHSFTQQHGH